VSEFDGTPVEFRLGYALGLLERLIEGDPLVTNEMGSEGCVWCQSREGRTGLREPWVTNHETDCAWVVAMRFLDHELPAGHIATLDVTG
jgi:hypothetical protein